MPTPNRLLPWCAAAYSIVTAGSALADPCSVDVSSALSPEWQRAARSLDAGELGDGDCERVRVRATERGAAVTVTTRDGRRAERPMEKPEELAPTVAALRVTVVTEKEDDVTAAAAPAVTAAARGPAADRGPVAPARASADDGSATLLSLGAGTRGGEGAFYSPVVAGTVSLLRSRWEFGLGGSLEFQYTNVSKPDSDTPGGGGAALGVFGGRREPAGAFELFGGARLSVAALFGNMDVSVPAMVQERPPAQENPAEARIGGYLGASVPRQSAVRLRADLSAELAAGPRQDPKLSPQWAMGALLGLELSL